MLYFWVRLFVPVSVYLYFWIWASISLLKGAYLFGVSQGENEIGSY